VGSIHASLRSTSFDAPATGAFPRDSLVRRIIAPRTGAWQDKDFRLLLGGQLVWCELGRAALTATVPIALLADALTMLQLTVVAVGTGVLTVLFQTANSTALPNIVRQDQLPDALGVTHAAGSGLGIVGSAIAGAAYGLGRAVPFAVNAVSFLVSALTLQRIRAEFQEDRGAARPSVRELLRDIRQGLAWVWGRPVLRLLTVVEAADGMRYGAGYLIIIELAA
jgi:hypothetical protein